MDFPVKNGDTQGAQKCCRLQKTLKVTCLSKKCFSFSQEELNFIKIKRKQIYSTSVHQDIYQNQYYKGIEIGQQQPTTEPENPVGGSRGRTISPSVCPSEATKNCLFHNNIGFQFLIICQLIGFLSSIMSSCFFMYCYCYEILYIVH